LSFCDYAVIVELLLCFIARHKIGGTLAGTKVTIFNNGPLRVEGDFSLVDQDGKEFGLAGRTAITLCRCGHTGNSPFCDGSHKRENFASVVEARELPPKA
jgi:CDGSH-type Zn-finger protein